MAEPLLEEIERHLAQTGMAESAFGRGAVNDWSFVRSLRRGRRVWPETADRVRAFMAANAPAPVAEPVPMRRTVTCSVCDKRLDDRTVRGCQWQDCPQSERWAS